ncbi:MAG: Fic family protein [Sphingobacteriales bacterium JAD_PAG50586_3]|nr:MAG: Fic family protein [Sphingobacteriales bacterium JAD_PAG50586_3]
MKNIFSEIDQLKAKLDGLRPLAGEKVLKAFDIEYTYESNRIEGNTLTLQETALVVEKGLTISGKPLKDHLEAINHVHALDYVKGLVTGQDNFSQSILLDIHRLILQGIDNDNAGKYRTVPVMISGAKHLPPQPYLVAKQMEDYFIWYDENKDNLHPVELAAEMHERLVTIHPFIDGNGRTARLVMNLLLLQNGYPIVMLKGDADSRLEYYNALEKAQVENDKDTFLNLIAAKELDSLHRILSILT